MIFWDFLGEKLVDNFNFKRKIRESENVAVFCLDVDNFDLTRKIRENVAITLL